MKNRTSSSNKKCNKFMYPHPLIKNINEVIDEKDIQQAIPTYYNNLIPNNQTKTSSKYLRVTNNSPAPGEEFAIFLQPFQQDQTSHDLVTIDQPFNCNKCYAWVNPAAKFFPNTNQFQCCFCQEINSFQDKQKISLQRGHFAYAIQPSFQSKQQYVSEKQKQPQQCKECKQRESCKQRQIYKDIVLVIEASQSNYQNKVHEVILQCLQNLNSYEQCAQSQNDILRVGFIFFDDKSLSFFDQDIEALIKVNFLSDQSEPVIFLDELPLDSDSFFKSAKYVSTNLSAIIDSVMYQAFSLQITKLSYVQSIIAIIFNHKTIVQFFISKIQQKSQALSKQSFFQKIFSDRSNIYQQVQPLIQNKIIPQTKVNHHDENLPSNFQYFVFSASPKTYKSIAETLKNNLIKIYEKPTKNGLMKFKKQFYYDLYQNLTKNHNYNVHLIVRCSKNLEIKSNQLQLIKQQQFKFYKEIHWTINKLHDYQMLTVLFKINNVNDKSNTNRHTNMQFQFIQKRNITHQPIQHFIFNHQFNSTSFKDNQWFQNIDDEAYFYFLLKKILEESTTTSSDIAKKKFKAQLQNLSSPFQVENCQEINLPLQLKHTFLYGYLLQKQQIFKCPSYSFEYESLKYLKRSNLQQFSKQMYFRTYTLHQNQIINVKFEQKYISRQEITFIENGDRIFFVIGNEVSVQKIKLIFGYFDMLSTLCVEHYELPELQTNKQYRKAIQQIRSLHRSNFLRLQILELGCDAYEKMIGKYLYNKDQHKYFMKRIWSQAKK